MAWWQTLESTSGVGRLVGGVVVPGLVPIVCEEANFDVPPENPTYDMHLERDVEVKATEERNVMVS